MALNNVRANEPPPMSPYIRELEDTIKNMQTLIAQLNSQVKTLNNRK